MSFCVNFHGDRVAVGVRVYVCISVQTVAVIIIGLCHIPNEAMCGFSAFVCATAFKAFGNCRLNSVISVLDLETRFLSSIFGLCSSIQRTRFLYS